ncbi:DUF2306 domain-containing protein [Bacillus bingmayongensis]|uniref:DUF2306 domain-containing protein n=1 Tax=Bacillus bingmayongensis TaxID=1150157 RepID=UPI001C8EB4DD|nr:DUF2306 domain-containing protein [Bacillus bingmayongensis]MBY0597129.1 DUF2306 domain-containing protein [Bacillus bingmayongensis]
MHPLFPFFLVIHIIAGFIFLLIGLISSFALKQRGIHTIFGELYHGFYVIVFVTAIILAILHWEQSAYLFYIALFSYGLALLGYTAVKIKWNNWIITHISGMLGSYIGIITATLITNAAKIPLLKEFPTLLIWFLPTIIGTPLITIIINKTVKRNITA